MIQKIPVMGYNHGARTGKKSREKVDMKALRLALAGNKQDSTKEPKSKKSDEFDDFAKSDINKIKSNIETYKRFNEEFDPMVVGILNIQVI
jgi:hypothetical protein